MKFDYLEHHQECIPPHCKQLSRKPEPPSLTKQYYIPKGPVSSSVRSRNAKRNKHKTPSVW